MGRTRGTRLLRSILRDTCPPTPPKTPADAPASGTDAGPEKGDEGPVPCCRDEDEPGIAVRAHAPNPPVNGIRQP